MCIYTVPRVDATGTKATSAMDGPKHYCFSTPTPEMNNNIADPQIKFVITAEGGLKQSSRPTCGNVSKSSQALGRSPQRIWPRAADPRPRRACVITPAVLYSKFSFSVHHYIAMYITHRLGTEVEACGVLRLTRACMAQSRMHASSWLGYYFSVIILYIYFLSVHSRHRPQQMVCISSVNGAAGRVWTGGTDGPRRLVYYLQPHGSL